MSRQYRIRVYGTQRKNIDPALLAQVVILLGRHLQQQRQQSHHQDAAHPKPSKNPSVSLGRGNPGSVESLTEHRSPTAKNDADGAGGGAGELS
jgi:hypothetical protein